MPLFTEIKDELADLLRIYQDQSEREHKNYLFPRVLYPSAIETIMAVVASYATLGIRALLLYHYVHTKSHKIDPMRKVYSIIEKIEKNPKDIGTAITQVKEYEALINTFPDTTLNGRRLTELVKTIKEQLYHLQDRQKDLHRESMAKVIAKIESSNTSNFRQLPETLLAKIGAFAIHKNTVRPDHELEKEMNMKIGKSLSHKS